MKKTLDESTCFPVKTVRVNPINGTNIILTRYAENSVKFC